MSEKYKIVNNPNAEFVDLDDLKVMMNNCQKIALIKEFRRVSNMGLKDAKDTVEKYNSTLGYDQEGLLDEFRPYLDIADPLTKEEFMHIVEQAVDTMDEFHFTDMLEAVKVLCENIDRKGGLDALAKERSKFLNKI